MFIYWIRLNKGYNLIVDRNASGLRLILKTDSLYVDTCFFDVMVDQYTELLIIIGI